MKMPLRTEETFWQDIGYFVEAIRHEASVEFRLIRAGSDDNGKPYSIDACGLETSAAEAEARVTGYVKWDGCSNIDFNLGDSTIHHFCGLKELSDFCEALKRLYPLAIRMMPENADNILG